MTKKISNEELARMVAKGFLEVNRKLDKLPTKSELWKVARLQESVASIKAYLRETFNAPIK